jgi:uncharacterized UBP type Zn finger protein
MQGESSLGASVEILLEAEIIFYRHYVAFIRKEISGQLEWVLFNDEKVVKADQVEEMKRYAYIYFFSRLD